MHRLSSALITACHPLYNCGFLATLAGQHFEIREEGDWWAAVPDEEWPDAASGQREIIMSDFAPGVGDRRQEIVFIGAGMDEVSKQSI
jgi:hypothetical protein